MMDNTPPAAPDSVLLAFDRMARAKSRRPELSRYAYPIAIALLAALLAGLAYLIVNEDRELQRDALNRDVDTLVQSISLRLETMSEAATKIAHERRRRGLQRGPLHVGHPRADAAEAGTDAHGLRRRPAARPLVGGVAGPARRHRAAAQQRDRRRRGARRDRPRAEVALGVLLATLRGRVRSSGWRQRQSVHGPRRARVSRGGLPRSHPRACFVAADAARHRQPRARAELPDLPDRRCRNGTGNVDAERGAAGRRALCGPDRAVARRPRDRGIGLQAAFATARQRTCLARRRTFAGRHGDPGRARAARRAAGARRARAARGDCVPACDGGLAGHWHGSDRPRRRHPPRQPGLLPDDRMVGERTGRPRPALPLLACRPLRRASRSARGHARGQGGARAASS